MPLFFHECIHVGLSLLAAYIAYKKYKLSSKYLVVTVTVALIGGVLIDLDHLIDYWLAYGLKLDLPQFLRSEQFDDNGKIYVLFHAYEYILILLVPLLFLRNKLHKVLIVSFTLAVLFHLLLDSISYNLHPGTYFILYRVLNNFHINSMVLPQ